MAKSNHSGAPNHPVARIEGRDNKGRHNKGRDNKGRFTNGGAPGRGGRPGLINVVTRSLREEIMAGFSKNGGVEGFVADLLETSPPSAAALLCKLLPPEPV